MVSGRYHNLSIETDDTMVRGMRKRLVLICTVVMTVALACIIVTASMIGYSRMSDEADEILAVLEENNGAFPESMLSEDGTTDNAATNITVNGAPQNVRGRTLANGISTEAPYESRFFVVSVYSDGTMSADLGHIVSIGEASAFQMASDAIDTEHQRGFVGDFRYSISHHNGNTTVTFLDRGRQMDQLRTLVIGIGISEAAVFAMMLILITIWSKHAVMPIAESYAKQRRFIADAGHDIKTPITVIQADAEVLGIDYGYDNEWLQSIKEQCKKMDGLVNDLMLITRLDMSGMGTSRNSDDARLGKSAIDLSGIISTEACTYMSVARTMGKTLTVNVSDGIRVDGDEKGARRLIGILCDNAMKYSSDGSNVNVALREQKGSAVLTVTNSVEDVDRSSIDKWFDRFYREDTVRNHDRGDGYGIGLSIAKAVVTDMNGSIDATLSRDGHTLSMTIRIPLAKEDMPQRRFPWETAGSTTRRHGTKASGSERYRHHRHEHGTSNDTKDGMQNVKTSETDSGNVGDVSSSTQDTESPDDGVHKQERQHRRQGKFHGLMHGGRGKHSLYAVGASSSAAPIDRRRYYMKGL